MEKKLIWVGEEINMLSPTEFPKVSEIVEYMVESMIGEPAFGVFKQRIEAYNTFIHHIHYNIKDCVYPEVMLMQWNKIKRVSVNEGLTSLLSVSYNLNHCYLAMLLEYGISVVTTNIDLCIELAYQDIMDNKDNFQRIEHENGVSIYAAKREGTGKIYHLHGTIEEPATIGGSMEIGKAYFSNTFRACMTDWMSQEYTVYVIGYPCKDIYDVVTYFVYLKHYLKYPKWKMEYVTHSFRKDLSYYTKVVCCCFQDAKIIHENDLDFLRMIYQKVSKNRAGKRKERIEEIEEICNNQIKVSCEWKSKVNQNLQEIMEYRDIMLLHINHALGISVPDLDVGIYSRLEAMDTQKRSMYMSLMFRYQYNLIPYYGYHAQKEIQEPLDGIEEELLRLCQDGYNQRNVKTSKISEKTEVLLMDYLSALRRGTKHSEMEEEAKALLIEIENMLPKEKDGFFVEIPRNNHKEYGDLYLMRAALRCISSYNMDNIKAIDYDIQGAGSYYSMTANLHGLVKSLRYKSLCYFCFYYKYGKKSYYDKAQKLKKVIAEQLFFQ
ncbi:MAG: SIR2-like domain [Clostridiales bacterium]|nr:SIR2-like domain [Clostridiales bacterium]